MSKRKEEEKNKDRPSMVVQCMVARRPNDSEPISEVSLHYSMRQCYQTPTADPRWNGTVLCTNSSSGLICFFLHVFMCDDDDDEPRCRWYQRLHPHPHTAWFQGLGGSRWPLYMYCCWFVRKCYFFVFVLFVFFVFFPLFLFFLLVFLLWYIPSSFPPNLVTCSSAWTVISSRFVTCKSK